MFKNILVLLLLFGSVDASAVYLRHCFNTGTDVNYSFIACVNSNFTTADRELPENHSRHCFNTGDDLQFGFISCVNDNFRGIKRNLERPLRFQHCFNTGDGVNYSFVSCVNNNFRKLERELDTEDEESK